MIYCSVVCKSASSDRQLTPVAIDKYKNLRALKGVSMLPVRYDV